MSTDAYGSETTTRLTFSFAWYSERALKNKNSYVGGGRPNISGPEPLRGQKAGTITVTVGADSATVAILIPYTLSSDMAAVRAKFPEHAATASAALSKVTGKAVVIIA